MQMHRRTAQPSGAATPEEADTRRRACIHFLRLFFRWQFRWQHKTTLWPGEESALFRRMSRCVRSFSERRVCTRFHPQKANVGQRAGGQILPRLPLYRHQHEGAGADGPGDFPVAAGRDPPEKRPVTSLSISKQAKTRREQGVSLRFPDFLYKETHRQGRWVCL